MKLLVTKSQIHKLINKYDFVKTYYFNEDKYYIDLPPKMTMVQLKELAKSINMNLYYHYIKI